MAVSEAELMTKIDDVKTKVLALQQQIVDGGISGAAEARVDAKLAELSVIADPTVQNPPGTPPDPGLPPDPGPGPVT